jgi:hypothetical protein
MGSWRELSEAERQRRVQQTLAPYGVEDVCRLCRDSESSVPAGRLANSFLEVKLYGSPFTAKELARLIEDKTVGPICHKVLVKHVGQHKEEFSAADGEVLATALLQLADGSGYPEGIRNQLEVAAASLSHGEEAIKRMRTYSASASDELLMQASRMMCASRDPRAMPLLLDVLGRRARAGVMVPGKLLIETASKLRGPSYEAVVRFLPLSRNDQERQDVLHALAYSGDFRVMPLLLQAYDDSLTGIRDWTSRDTSKEERGKYFHLWHCTRVFEPGMVSALTGPVPEGRRQAIELLDRASRFGAMLDSRVVGDALQVASREDPKSQQRLGEIQARFDAWEAEKAVRGK